MWLLAAMAKKWVIDSFQSRDRLEDLQGKTSTELQHKRVNLSSVYSRRYLDHVSK